jgi:predicted house-cleaning noncanonical NTP pyrophosphatase (MazG superfamily)
MIRKPYTVIDPLTVPIKVNNGKFSDLIALQTETNKFENALREEIRKFLEDKFLNETEREEE